MANEIATSFKSEGAQQVLSDFDKLTKKEQEMIVKGSKLGKTYEKMGRDVKNAGRQGKNSLSDMAKGMIAGVTASGLLQRGIAAVTAEIEKQAQRQRAAAGAQRTYADALANYVNNVRSITPKEFGRVQNFAQTQGKRIRGGAPEVANALADVTSKVGGIATPQEIRDQIEREVGLKAGGQTSINIAESAAASLHLQKKAGLNQRQAGNILQTFSGQAGGRASDFMSVLPGVLASAKASGADPAEAASLLGLFSKEASLDSSRAATVTQNILGKTDPLRLIKQGVKFKATDRVDQIVELLTRAGAGEFGGDTHKILTTAGLEGANASTILGILGKKEGRDTFAKFRQQMKFAKTTPRDQQKDLLRVLRTAEPVRTQAKQGAVAGRTGVIAAADPQLAARQAEVERVRALREELGLSGFGRDAVFETLIRRGSFDGPAGEENATAMIQGELGGFRQLTLPILDFLRGTTERELLAREEFKKMREGIEKLGDRIEGAVKNDNLNVPPQKEE